MGALKIDPPTLTSPIEDQADAPGTAVPGPRSHLKNEAGIGAE